MVSKETVEQQLKKIGFNPHAWGQAEVKELPHILLDHEEIFEAVNGTYEGGFALLLATNVRVLLVDKKPLNYLTIEDMRFDMINEIDYSHRLIGARIHISAGAKNFRFFSLNQPKLRKAIKHVQSCMAEMKKEQSEHATDQKQHLAQINQQLQSYLLAQHQQQQSLKEQLEEVQTGKKKADEIKLDEVKPSPELSDYLLAQSLIDKYKQENTEQLEALAKLQKSQEADKEVQGRLPAHSAIADQHLPPAPEPTPVEPQMTDLYAEGMKEIFGKRQASQPQQQQQPAQVSPQPAAPAQPVPDEATKHRFSYLHKPLEVNPLTIAYSKLPMALRNRKFGRPSFHAPSQAPSDTSQTQQPQTATSS